MRTVTIVIPAYDRADALRRTLATITPFASADVDILVVDDCSSTPDVEDACRPYGDKLRYVRTLRNSGVIGARNFAYGLATGDIIINLDDDSHFVDGRLIPFTLEQFSRNPALGVIAYAISSPGQPPIAPDTPPFRVYTYTGCGNAIRRTALQQAGLLSKHFWRQGEEIEHTLRLYDAGYEVICTPHLVVEHEQSPINRNSRRHLDLHAANTLKRVALLYPAGRVPVGIAAWFGFMLKHRRRMSWGGVVAELCRRDRGLLATLRDRAPVRNATLTSVTNVKRIEKLIRRRNA